MAPLTTSVTVSAPAAAAWELFVDTRRWPEWGPSVARVECDDRCIGEESHGRVQTVLGSGSPSRSRSFVPATTGAGGWRAYRQQGIALKRLDLTAAG